jgi:hypothetical protein
VNDCSFEEKPQGMVTLAEDCVENWDRVVVVVVVVEAVVRARTIMVPTITEG